MGHIPNNPAAGGTPYTGEGTVNPKKPNNPNSPVSVDPKRQTPSPKASDAEQTSMRERKIEAADESKKPSSINPEKKAVVDAVSSEDDGKKKPHKNPYFWAGAAATVAGCGLLMSPAAPIGIALLVMGLMAHTWAYVDACDDPNANQQQQQQQENAQQKQQGDDKGVKDNKEKQSNPLDDKTNINNANGRFMAKPVNYKGGPFDFSGKGLHEGNPPPPLNPQYSGPGFQGIYNAATKMGVPGETANNFMNGCANLLAGQPAGQLPANPSQWANLPLVQDFSKAVAPQIGPSPANLGLANSLLASAGLPPQPVQPLPAGGGITINNTNLVPSGASQPVSPAGGNKQLSVNINITDMLKKTMNNRPVEEKRQGLEAMKDGLKTEMSKSTDEKEIKEAQAILAELDKMLLTLKKENKR